MHNKMSVLFRLLIAVILLQTLYFKFTAQPESVELFSKLGMEPYGRIGTGIAELIASVLLFFPATVFFGALLSLGLMCGAIASHLLVIGIESQGDGGFLFLLAILVFLSSLALLYLQRSKLQDLLNRFKK